jgi:myo-inositol-hexaphosphate 3-phosphohydrolase
MIAAIDSHAPAYALLLLLSAPVARAQTPATSPTVETVPVPSSGDAADDIAIWVHPTQASSSLVIGTDKRSGLVVHDLAGNRLQYLPDGRLNNVDVRGGFLLSGREVTLVASGERDQDRLAIYAVDADARSLYPVAARDIALGIEVYGCCMYLSPWTGDTYFFCTSEDVGIVQQWRLFPAGAGTTVDAELVRTFDVGSQSEGCVADDENALLFVGEEGRGIWRYGAEPGAGSARTLVDGTSGGHLVADVEGLALYHAPGGAGYLVASSQGNNSFVVYERRPPHEHRLTFRVAANSALGIDEVSETDGIDVTSMGLGPAFPSGLFVAQDGSNPGANQNFKLVPWPSIARLANPPLIGAGSAVSAAFIASASSADPLRISFSDASTGNVTSWAWDFGDGATASERDPVHVYAAAGSYTVGLTVSGPDGADSTQEVVEVDSSGAGGGSGGGGGGGSCSIAPGPDGRLRGGDPSLALSLAVVLAALVLRRARRARHGSGFPAATMGR